MVLAMAMDLQSFNGMEREINQWKTQRRRIILRLLDSELREEKGEGGLLNSRICLHIKFKLID